MDWVTQTARLPVRSVDGHKGTFGTVCVVGGCCRGSRRYVGAPALAAIGALRAGCGLCRVMVPAPIAPTVLRLVPSATGTALPVGPDGGVRGRLAIGLAQQAAEHEVMVIGPGLGDGTGADQLVANVWSRVAGIKVVDADGLNALSRLTTLGPACGVAVATPHPGEARRLMKTLGLLGDATDARQRPGIAAAMAQRLGCIVVLKGQGTVISDGWRVTVNRSGGPWLATGGTGDVLAGMIGGLVAQHAGSADVFTLVRAGVLAHGRAGDRWAKAHRATGGMLAMDLAALIPAEVERLRPRGRTRPG